MLLPLLTTCFEIYICEENNGKDSFMLQKHIALLNITYFISFKNIDFCLKIKIIFPHAVY